MMEFPAVWLQFGFYGLAGLLCLLALLYVQNAIRHGSRMVLTVISCLIFLGGIVAIGWGSSLFLSQVDWTKSFSIALPSLSWLNFGR